MAKIIESIQGSASWHAHRANHYGASEAPAALGVSSYKSRGALLHEKKTGIVPDVDAATQKRFDQGHEFEAIARPWAEDMIGMELYPVVLADEIDGLPLSASLDGLTVDDSTAFEHKTGSKKLIAALDAGEIPEEYRVQMEQQMLISGASKCLFMASSGDRETMRHAWYESDADMRSRVIQGWQQFHKDLANYEPPAAEKTVTGSVPSALPALHIELSGAVTASNLEDYRDHAISVFENINTDLQTDQDFADAESAVKFCKNIEKRLEAAKEHALSQTADIDRLFKTIDEIQEQARRKRLELDKLVKSMKEERKREIFQSAASGLNRHVRDLQRELQTLSDWSPEMPPANADIAGAMKGKRTIATLRDAADTAVANAKIEADRIAREIRAAIDALKTAAEGYESLFPDGGQLVTQKSADDLRNLARARIAEHQEQERQRAEHAERARQQAEANAKRDQQHESAQAANTAKASPPAQTALTNPVVPRRPSDDQIIECIAEAFSVDHATARGWVAGMDLFAAEA